MLEVNKSSGSSEQARMIARDFKNRLFLFKSSIQSHKSLILLADIFFHFKQLSTNGV